MQTNPLYDEQELLLRVAAGEEAAFAWLFQLHRDQVFAVACKVTGLRAAAEDIVQEVFLKVWLQREELPAVRNFAAWLYTIAKNHIYNGLRKVAYEHDFLREMLAQDDKESQVLQQTDFQELQQILYRAIAGLPPQQRKVYLLSREENLKYHEIAELLQIAPSTVKTHMIEALRNIRQQLLRNGVQITLPVAIMAGVAAAVSSV